MNVVNLITQFYRLQDAIITMICGSVLFIIFHYVITGHLVSKDILHHGFIISQPKLIEIQLYFCNVVGLRLKMQDVSPNYTILTYVIFNAYDGRPYNSICLFS